MVLWILKCCAVGLGDFYWTGTWQCPQWHTVMDDGTIALITAQTHKLSTLCITLAQLSTVKTWTERLGMCVCLRECNRQKGREVGRWTEARRLCVYVINNSLRMLLCHLSTRLPELVTWIYQQVHHPYNHIGGLFLPSNMTHGGVTKLAPLPMEDRGHV